MLRQIEKMYKAFGDRNRLRIINMLRERSMCVCEITDLLKVSQSTVSGHLRVLKEAEIVEDRKDGQWIEYSLCRDEELNRKFLALTETFFKEDKELKEERERARGADRKILGKK